MTLLNKLEKGEEEKEEQEEIQGVSKNFLEEVSE